MVLGQVLILMNRNRFMLEMVKPFTPSNPCTLCQHMVRRKENVQSQHQYATIVQDDAALSVAKRPFFCATCYERTGGAIMVICSSSTGRDCFTTSLHCTERSCLNSIHIYHVHFFFVYVSRESGRCTLLT